jgi:hypothetical protein
MEERSAAAVVDPRRRQRHPRRGLVKNRLPTSLLDAIGLRCRSRSVGASAVIDQGTHVYVGHARFKFCHKIPKSERQEEPDAQSLRE